MAQTHTNTFTETRPFPFADANPYSGRPWRKSYVPSVSPELAEYPYANLADLGSLCAARYGNKPAFTTVLPNGWSATLTFAEVNALSDKFASYLKNELGLSRGDRVAVQLPNCLAFPVVAFGVFKAGCVLVNVNPLYTVPEMVHQFNDSGAKVLVIMDLFGDKLTEAVPRTGLRHVVIANVADLFPFARRAIVKLKLKLEKKIPHTKVHALSFNSALAAGNAGPKLDESLRGSREDIAALQYTGGTTGVSKGAVLTHGNLLANVQQITTFGKPRIEIGETMLTALPLYHIFAFTANFLSFYALGAHNILIPSPRPLVNMEKAMRKFKPTWFSGVNTLFSGLLNEAWFQKGPCRSLKCSIAGGMALQSAVARKWKSVVGSPVVEGYGLTESSPVLTFNPIGGNVKPDTVGIPMPSTDLIIVDAAGNPVPLGEPGELLARGPQVMVGYWQRPDETAKVMKDGWLATGDIATMDAEGFVRIVDRKKDMILVSGFNVYPNEVEDCIAKHPDVLEVAVIGVPDENSGEIVRAYVVSRNSALTADAIREHCKQHLTAYKCPRSVEFRKDLPKTNVGKILRKELRAEVMARKA